MSKEQIYILVTGASRGIGAAILESFNADNITAIGHSTGDNDGLIGAVLDANGASFVR